MASHHGVASLLTGDLAHRRGALTGRGGVRLQDTQRETTVRGVPIDLCSEMEPPGMRNTG